MNENTVRRVDRRDLLKGSLGLAGGVIAGGSAGPLAARGADTRRDRDLIRRENERPGARDWQLTYVALDSAHAAIARRASKATARGNRWPPGRRSISWSAPSPPADFTIDVFRMGYYGGRGARLMTTLGPFHGKVQPHAAGRAAASPRVPLGAGGQPDDPRRLAQRGLPGPTFARPGKPTARNPWQSYTVFIVRDDRPADVLFQCSDNTWQAYNRWPDRFSLYDDGTVADWTSLAGIDVSFDRPYGKYRQIYENPQSVGSGDFLCWEFPMVYWLEQQGYDVSYARKATCSAPSAARSARPLSASATTNTGTSASTRASRRCRDAGVSLLFLSGNTVCWVTPFKPSSDGRPNRIITRAAPYRGPTMGSEPAKDPVPLRRARRRAL